MFGLPAGRGTSRAGGWVMSAKYRSESVSPSTRLA
jgi:hypothetical protein